MVASQKAVKLTICRCNFNMLRGVPTTVERFLQARQKMIAMADQSNDYEKDGRQPGCKNACLTN